MIMQGGKFTLSARQIYDSRGKPTIEVELETASGYHLTASVPSGASTGRWEAHELCDGDSSKHFGQGVSKAVHNVNTIIAPALKKLNEDTATTLTQCQMDSYMVNELDKTANKSNLGANAILGVSMAIARALAFERSMPLYRHLQHEWSKLNQNSPIPTLSIAQSTFPMPHFNLINGGRHAGNRLAFQEFMLVPKGAQSFEEAMRIGTECYHTLRHCIIRRWGTGAIGVGDEGGFAPNEISTPTLALELIHEAVERSGHAHKVVYALDVAASEFAVQDATGATLYDLDFKNPDKNEPKNLITGTEMIALYCRLCDKFPIVSIEDPFGEDDWNNWTALMTIMKERGGVRLIGDDLCVTNPDRIMKAQELGCCNGLLVKPNQIGTVSETMQAVRLARSFGWSVMASHRSGDTEDSFIADFAVGVGAEAIKCGAPCRSERVAKYNRLLWIESKEGKEKGEGGR